MIFNMSGGGGGAGLNFKIVGNPQPAEAKENTIWIDTDVDITGWRFNATEPENPVTGIVWIYTGTTSPAAFNALKKNGIQVYPLSAKQYVSGAWVDKTAKSYQNGAWVDWVTRLYNLGDECADITGGWTLTKAAGATSVKNADHVYFSYSGSSNIQSYLRTTNKITFPNGHTTLKARLDITSHFSASNGSTMGLTTSMQANRDDFAFSTAFTDKGNGIVVSLDISNASGDFYVSFYSGMKTSKLYEVWFE